MDHGVTDLVIGTLREMRDKESSYTGHMGSCHGCSGLGTIQ